MLDEVSETRARTCQRRLAGQEERTLSSEIQESGGAGIKVGIKVCSHKRWDLSLQAAASEHGS